jgi:transcriptional regulator with XRE-family HTH domain
VEFSRMAGGVMAKAERFGVGKSTIGNWQTGLTKPDGAKRERIFEQGGPEPDAWDEPYVEPAAQFEVPGEEPAAEPATPESLAETAARQLAQIQKLQRELAAPAGMADMRPDEKVRLQLQMSDAIAKLSVFTGVKLTHRMITASPLWQEVCDVIIAALEPWPDALQAVAKALDELKAS